MLAEMRVTSTTGCTPLPMPPARLGESCANGAPCDKDSVCSTDSRCVQCAGATGCSNGAVCGALVPGVYVCGPGQHLGQTGDPCALDTDCASNACDGLSISSLATVFGVTDAGCPTAAPACDLDASLDAGTAAAACACILTHGGNCH